MNNTIKQQGLRGVIAAWALVAGTAWAHEAAPVTAEGAWARMSVAGQQATGAFMKLTAQQPMRLVGVQSPAAQAGEIHEMTLQGDVMRMRAIEGLDLPADHTVELKPGGYHLMLQQLKAPLAQGTQVLVTLVFEDAQGKTSQLQLQVPVLRMPSAAHHSHGAVPHHGKAH